jgi:tetratricopeptide (TPR) repeat protein
MIRHQVYFDTLGTMKEDSAFWRSVFAGLSVLRLVDSYAEAAQGGSLANWAEIHSVRTAIENVGQGDPVRGVLTAVVDEVIHRNAVDDSVLSTLLAYGRALDYEASWGLATDVFSTVAKLARPEKNARLAVEANVAVGGAARRNGDWETSARAYSQAAYIADTLGDRQGVLTVQVGIANTYLAKGNIPQAEAILDDVIVQATDQGFAAAQSRALHSRAAVAHRRGEAAAGLKFAHEALNLTDHAGERDQIVEDIAGMFTELGMYDAAQDAHLILVATAQSKLVKWTATLNLMELAGLQSRQAQFENYARELANAPMGAWVRAHYFLFYGEGLLRFDQVDKAEVALQEAITLADANQFHEVSFKAQQALVQAKSAHRATKTFIAPSAWTAQELSPVTHAMSDLRKAAEAAR